MHTAGWTQLDLSRHSGVPTSQISLYARDSAEPRLGKLLALADALQVNPSWLAWNRGASDSDQPDYGAGHRPAVPARGE